MTRPLSGAGPACARARIKPNRSKSLLVSRLSGLLVKHPQLAIALAQLRLGLFPDLAAYNRHMLTGIAGDLLANLIDVNWITQ
jgi:hypothetical protein